MNNRNVCTANDLKMNFNGKMVDKIKKHVGGEYNLLDIKKSRNLIVRKININGYFDNEFDYFDLVFVILFLVN